MDVYVDVDYPDSQQALRICAALKNPLAWAYPIRLWSWAFKNEKRDGFIDKDAVLLAMLCRYDGDAETFARAMLDTEVLDDEPAGWRIRGSSRWGRFWRERDRLQAINETRRKARNQRVDFPENATRAPRVQNRGTETELVPTGQDATRAPRVHHAESTRAPRVQNELHENAEDFEHATRAPRVQHAIDTRGERVHHGLTSSSSSSSLLTERGNPARAPASPRGDAMTASLIGQHHLGWLARKGVVKAGSRLTADESKACNELAQVLGLDFTATIDAFHRDNRSFYVERRWPLRALLRDLREHQPRAKPPRPRRHVWHIPDEPMAKAPSDWQVSETERIAAERGVEPSIALMLELSIPTFAPDGGETPRSDDGNGAPRRPGVAAIPRQGSILRRPINDSDASESSGDQINEVTGG